MINFPQYLSTRADCISNPIRLLDCSCDSLCIKQGNAEIEHPRILCQALDSIYPCLQYEALRCPSHETSKRPTDTYILDKTIPLHSSGPNSLVDRSRARCVARNPPRMHFAFPPRKSSNPPPYASSRSSRRLPGARLWSRTSRLQQLAIVVLSGFATIWLLVKMFSRGGTPSIPAGTPKAVVVTTLDPGLSESYREAIMSNRKHYAQKHGKSCLPSPSLPSRFLLPFSFLSRQSSTNHHSTTQAT